ncbi:protein kinase [Streptomyces sp. NA02536]|uniref:protein kinase domain-containing protein n=1 Tax=Streptomyces sp. NA02536 TaxID=2742133 RepID=UPI00158FC849|nr:protein kinase [Streptomyces sp. NA02536]QKV98361.1 protein kinase [Streptomyces sp. NA02536]QKW04501.1 protein kinase [Streptomyces sp. NA02536]
MDTETDAGQDLVVAYDRWRTAPPPEAGTDRVMAVNRLSKVIRPLIEVSDKLCNVAPGPLSGPLAAFEYEGHDYLLLASDAGPHEVDEMTAEFAKRAAAFPEVRHVLLCTGPRPASLACRAAQLLGDLAERVIVLDRSHLDAAVCGLATLADLVRAAFRRGGALHPALADLVLPRAVPVVPASMDPAGRRRELFTEFAAPHTEAGAGAVEVRPLLVGGLAGHIPTGLAVAPDGQVLVTVDGGIVNLDPRTGTTRWRLALPGCDGPVLPRDDGSFLVMCGGTVLCWHEGVLSAVAGGFPPGARLVAGDRGEVWVLSGSGVTFGSGEGTLALTWIGLEAGRQARYSIAFDAAVRSAVCLGKRRFLLAACGHHTMVDLALSTDVGPRTAWIPSHAPYPGHTLASGGDGAVTLSPDGSGTSLVLHHVDTATMTGTPEPLVAVPLGIASGLAAIGDGSALLLGMLPGVPGEQVPVLLRLSGLPHGMPDPDSPVGKTDTGSQEAREPYREVAEHAAGNKRHYRQAAEKIGVGGQGEVARATHKPTGVEVAFKRRTSDLPDAVARMTREIELGQRLGGHPHVMPVLDAAADHRWFIMPLAEATAEDRWAELRDPTQLRVLVDAVASALAAAHEHDWVHRDVKPSNILLLNGSWRLADWGLVRRPRGETTNPDRTRFGVGSPGFAAPELSNPIGAHDASPASDIYGLGQVIGWALNGEEPHANVPLLPPQGPWRHIVQQATQLDPAHRPQNIAAFLALVGRETATSRELPAVRAQRLLAEANTKGSGQRPVEELLDLAAANPTDTHLYLEVLSELNSPGPALRRNPRRAAAVLQAMGSHRHADPWPSFATIDRVMLWLLEAARAIGNTGDLGLLSEATTALCSWDEAYDQWIPQDATTKWLRTLRGTAAAEVAGVLRRFPASARHYGELTGEMGVDLAVRSAIYHVAQDQK